MLALMPLFLGPLTPLLIFGFPVAAVLLVLYVSYRLLI